MRKSITKYGRTSLAIVMTLLTVMSTWMIMFVVYGLMNVDIRAVEIIAATACPLLLAPILIWHLLGLVIKLDALEKEMREYATFDQLTGVLTRRSFVTKATEHFHVARRYAKPLALLMVDLDDFKAINDTYGHFAGDEVLKSFGLAVNLIKRESDLVARFGGEEFILLLPETDRAGAIHFANALHTQLKETQARVDDNTIAYTVSVGIGLFSDISNAPDLQELIQQADAALYAAKTSGKNRSVLYGTDTEKFYDKQEQASLHLTTVHVIASNTELA